MQTFLLAAIVATGTFVSNVAAAWNVSDIEESTRRYWCESQVAQCPLLCQDLGKTDTTNKCWWENLYFQCLCTDGVRPNITEYTQTIPYFQCTLEQGDCIKACGPNNECSNDCKKKYQCGAENPRKPNKTSTASASSASKTSSSSAKADDGGFGSAGDGSDDDSGNSNAGAKFGNMCGSALIALGVAAGAAFVGL